MGVGWEELHRINPALILLSIASFGQTGPYRDFEADDTVLAATSGMLYVKTVQPGRAPVRPLGLRPITRPLITARSKRFAPSLPEIATARASGST